MPGCSDDVIKDIVNEIVSTFDQKNNALTNAAVDVVDILKSYNSNNGGTIKNMARLLLPMPYPSFPTSCRFMRPGWSIKTVIILAVDHGFEHGPNRSFSVNEEAYDPSYHARCADTLKLNGYAAPLGMLEMIAEEYAKKLPLILKLNNGDMFSKEANSEPDQAITASVEDAVRLGCVGVGFTIYPGSVHFKEMLEEAREIIKEAKAHGLFTVVWAYPRGNSVAGRETDLDVICYAVHIAALIGAHIIKTKIPTKILNKDTEKKLRAEFKYDEGKEIETRHLLKWVMRSAFNSKRIVLFSGGEFKEDDKFYQEAADVFHAGAHGLMIGRNIFQRADVVNFVLGMYPNR